MSYTLGFAPDAQSQWQSLPVPLQEAALDEADRLAIDPPRQGEHVAEVVIDEGAVRHYTFVHVLIDHARRKLTVVGVGYVRRDPAGK
ncbi:MAG TPA: hypothetical protein VN541_07890 [Tepidisphaeraceae bacterium]|nr:hypothetical protein [Tepidisphaeraceae bacterium]